KRNCDSDSSNLACEVLSADRIVCVTTNASARRAFFRKATSIENVARLLQPQTSWLAGSPPPAPGRMQGQPKSLLNRCSRYRALRPRKLSGPKTRQLFHQQKEDREPRRLPDGHL